MTACLAPITGNGFLNGLLRYVDCQAQNLGEGGYQALAAPGSLAALAVTALLTLFVAVFGLRMMLGRTPDVHDAIVGIVKVGAVILLATSWPAYRTVVYDLVTHGPAEIFASIGQSANLPGANGGLVARLQNVDNALIGLAESATGAGVPIVPAAPVAPPATTANSAASPIPAVSAPASIPVTLSSESVFGLARITYLIATIGALAIVRLIAGLLLALAPLFAGLLLFDTTRGWFSGWLRGLAAAALGTAGVTLVLGVELALLQPWLVNVVQQRSNGFATPAAPVELLVMTLAFAVALFGVIAGMGRIAFAAPLAVLWRALPTRVAEFIQVPAAQIAIPASSPVSAKAPPSRAFKVADAVAAVQRREAAALIRREAEGQSSSRGSQAASSREGMAAARVPLGQSFRRTHNRVSSSAERRDHSS